MIHRLLTLAAAAILAGTTPRLAQPRPPARPTPAVPTKAPEAVVTLENGGEIRIELFPADAPRHVDNFVKLASRGFYDGQRFHRVVPNFVVQIGDPKSRTSPLDHPDMGTGGPGDKDAPGIGARALGPGLVALGSRPDPSSGPSPPLVMP